MRFHCLPVLIFLSLASCSDTFTSSHANLEAAQQDIERGWIPPILPPSTRDIRDRHNIDTNIGEGTFSFHPDEIDSFITKGAHVIKINPAPDSHKKRLQTEGYRFLTYSRGTSSWLIALHPDGRGYYEIPGPIDATGNERGK